ncbi:lytic transglycosylase domain-containing protein [Streptomyces sparsogenes]|uniref:Secreted protein n=1 Tax=Streptomyces sparsogenes DSM 40356 TaxID=1331668 RepID=A0A1R1SHX8_9ACTN|nr:lytic transglycosylase domain-containing protein [Streptomyces sparsogenes]OMI37619.1 secreted protein [Streptomyces sparsogenes DSM 40356]
MAPHIGRRLRKGAATTAVAAVVMAALTASQAPGFAGTAPDRHHDSAGETPTPPTEAPIDGGSSYHTDLPPLRKPGKPGASIDLPGLPDGVATAEAGIPATVLDAYKKAEAALKESKPGCNLPWQLLAAIGKVESGQARGGRVDAEGTTYSPILGPVLNGNGFARITDTDGGAYDGDTTHDRAVGPMQFIPSTWATWGRDGNGDGERNPNNIYDAALAAGAYLCANGRDLSVKAHLDQAILGYNHSQEYLATVLSWFEYYKKGTHAVPDGTGVLPDPDKAGSGKDGGKGDKGDKGGKGGKGDKGKDHSGSGSPTPLPDPTPGGGDNSTSEPPTPGSDDPGTPTPGTPTPEPPTPGTPAPTPSAVAKLKTVGTTELTATAGTEFAVKPRVRAETTDGKPVPGVLVRYEIRGETDARFPGGATRVTAITGSDGTATAPALRAGETTGSFTVRATVVGRGVDAAEFPATVKARPVPQADALVRTDDKVLKAEAGGSFADTVAVKATYKGKAAAGVAATATMITSDSAKADKPTQNDKGPYFKDAKGQPIRTLTALKTDANGQLILPKIYTDDQTGTFLLRLTIAGGATLTIELTVTQPAAQEAAG